MQRGCGIERSFKDRPAASGPLGFSLSGVLQSASWQAPQRAKWSKVILVSHHSATRQVRSLYLTCNVCDSHRLKISMSVRHVLLGSVSVSGMIGILIVLFLGYLILSTYLQYRKLQHIRGPWLASISPLWLFYYACCGTLYLAVEEALEKYGKPIP